MEPKSTLTQVRSAAVCSIKLIGVDFAADLSRQIIHVKLDKRGFYAADPLRKAHSGSYPCERTQKTLYIDV